MAGEAFGLGKAEVKGKLAELGQTLRPDATMKTYRRPAPGEQVAVVLLDGVRQNELPEYCTHGYANCVNCDQLCWLGHETEKAVSSGRAFPLCLDCAPSVVPEGIEPSEHLKDHLRADGPHE